MDISHYLSILRDRLTEEEIHEKEIEKILIRERSLLSGASEQALFGLLTPERLDIIVASTVARSNRQANKLDSTEPLLPQLGSTGPIISKYAVQDSPQQDESATIQPASIQTVKLASHPIEESTLPVSARIAENETVKISAVIADEKTVVLSRENLTPHEGSGVLSDEEKTREHFTLTSTATVVISDRHPEDVTKTMAVSPGLQKLLSETKTIRISELDTVAFDAVKDANEGTVRIYQPIKVSNDPPPQEDATRPIRKIPVGLDPSVDMPVDRSSIAETIERICERGQEITKQRNEPSPHHPAFVENTAMSSEDLRNPHPFHSLLLLVFLFLPTIVFVGLGILTAFILGNIILSLIFALLSFVFLFLFLFPFLVALYSLFFAILYLTQGDGMIAFGELGIFLIAASLSAIFTLFLYKPYIQVLEKLVNAFTFFNRKIYLLIHNLYRYTLKGVDRI